MNITAKLTVLLFLLLNQVLATGQKLKVGHKAPNIETIDANGHAINLSDFKGQKVLLAFFRYAACPVCNYRVHELIENYENITLNDYKVIAIFESNNNTLSAYLKDTPVPFIIIGDPLLTYYKMFNVEKSFFKTMGSVFQKQSLHALKKGNKLINNKLKRDGNLTRMPADFIIDENGIIQIAYYGNNIGDHLPLSVILKQ